MKKRVIIAVVATLVFLGCVLFLYKNNMEEKGEPSQVSVDHGEVLASSKEGYNSVVIYKQENMLVIDLESEAAFFEGTQFTVETQGEVKAEDIEIIWTTLGGGTEREEDNDFIIAEIKISETNKLIVDTKINFAKKAFDAIEDVLER